MIASPSEMTYIPGGFFLLSMSKFTGEYDMRIHVWIWMDMEHEDTWKLHWMEWFPCSLHVVQHCALLMNESLLTVPKTIKLLCGNAFKVVLSACSFWVPRPCESYVSVGLLFCCPTSVAILDRTDQHYLFEISTMDSSIVGESHHFCGGWKRTQDQF